MNRGGDLAGDRGQEFNFFVVEWNQIRRKKTRDAEKLVSESHGHAEKRTEIALSEPAYLAGSRIIGRVVDQQRFIGVDDRGD